MSTPRRALSGLLFIVLALACAPAHAQTAGAKARPQKLPSADKIVNDHLKAAGGRKRLSALRDAIYEWGVQGGGRARTFRKSPASVRVDIQLAGGELNDAANLRTAWTRGADGTLRTLTDEQANAAKLQAALDATRLVDFKKQEALARTVALEAADGEAAYVVEFARRNGARLRYRFSAASKLLAGVEDVARGLTLRYGDWRAREGGVLEPHRLELRAKGEAAPTVLLLETLRYNTGLGDQLFDPPSDQALNIPELLRAVARNQDALDSRVSDYTYTRKQIEREINDKGEVKKEKTLVHEIYPVPGGGRVLKLISEDGVPLPPERAAKEEKRVAEALEKLERENARRREKREESARKKGETGAGEEGDDELVIAMFLRACEFISPRRERFREREVIVFDFRPRPGFRPRSRGESIIGKLTGAVWIDPADKQVMRLEARLAEGVKVGGGLLASIRSGSAFAFEQTRLPDGVWLPRFAQINASAKLFLFAGLRIDATREYSNYKRFSASVTDAAVEAPKPAPPRKDE